MRVTSRNRDASSIAARAQESGVDLVVAAGGDGTVNEVVNGVLSVAEHPTTAIGVVPIGCANDFARGCGIPTRNPTEALRLAANAETRAIDVARINDRYFVNALVTGFAAQVTYLTSEWVKRAMGGAAYRAVGCLTFPTWRVFRADLNTPRGRRKDVTIFSALANGTQAGGVRVAPRARLDDGMLDLVSVPNFSLDKLPVILRDLKNLGHAEPELLRYEQLKWLEIESDREIRLSPDGERLSGRRFRIDVLNRRALFALPPAANEEGSERARIGA